MNIEKVKYFLDLVECRNFTETAKRNYVSQTTISQQIASLEKEFEISLIDRKKTPIEPTRAGWTFHKEAQVIWQQYIHMKEKMKSYVEDNEQVVFLEYGGIMDVRSLLRSIPNFSKEHENIRIELHKVQMSDISDYLVKGIHDIAISFDSVFEGNDEIVTYPLYQGCYSAVMANDHPLTNEKTLSQEQLYSHPLIMLDPEIIGSSYDLMEARAKIDGYTPDIARTADDVETEFFYIMTEGLIGFVPDNYDLGNLADRLKIIPIENSSHCFEIVAATLKKVNNPAVKLLVEAMMIGKTNRS